MTDEQRLRLRATVMGVYNQMFNLREQFHANQELDLFMQTNDVVQELSSLLELLPIEEKHESLP